MTTSPIPAAPVAPSRHDLIDAHLAGAATEDELRADVRYLREENAVLRRHAYLALTGQRPAA